MSSHWLSFIILPCSTYWILPWNQRLAPVTISVPLLHCLKILWKTLIKNMWKYDCHLFNYKLCFLCYVSCCISLSLMHTHIHTHISVEKIEAQRGEVPGRVSETQALKSSLLPLNPCSPRYLVFVHSVMGSVGEEQAGTVCLGKSSAIHSLIHSFIQAVNP